VDEPRLHRGWVSLYAGAFALMITAGAVLVAASLGRLESIRLLWVSAWLSVAAIAVALASVLVTRRR
jgi:predicted MFS family arabinose efflux permease